jgi:chemotaxis protein CheD
MKNVAASPGVRTVHVIQGDFRTSDTPDEILTTILGSCVAACLCDPVRGVGGMNHFLLPNGNPDNVNIKYGTHAMELLINSLLKRGAVRDRLEAKVFGGARMLSGLPNIGEANANFVQLFLKREAIRCVVSNLGGTQARKVRFFPTTGKAQQMVLDEIQTDPAAMPRAISCKMPAGDVEMF